MTRLAFYKAEKGGIWSKLLALWTQGPYSHVEVVFFSTPPTTTLVPVIQHDAGGTLCFSAAENDGGTRYKVLAMDDGKWDFHDISEMDDGIAFTDSMQFQNIKYNWDGLVAFVLKFYPDNKSEVFCSEVVTMIAQKQGFLKDLEPSKTSPNALWKRLQKGV